MFSQARVAISVTALLAVSVTAQVAQASHCYRCSIPGPPYYEFPGLCLIVGLGQPGYSECYSDPGFECLINHDTACSGDAADAHQASHVLVNAVLLRLDGEARRTFENAPTCRVFQMPSDRDGLASLLEPMVQSPAGATLSAGKSWVNEPAEEYTLRRDGRELLKVITTPVSGESGVFVHLRSDSDARLAFHRLISETECVATRVRLGEEQYLLVLRPVTVSFGDEGAVSKVNRMILRFGSDVAHGLGNGDLQESRALAPSLAESGAEQVE